MAGRNLTHARRGFCAECLPEPETVRQPRRENDGKECTGCWGFLPWSAFGKSAKTKDSHQHRCRSCQSAEFAARPASKRRKYKPSEYVPRDPSSARATHLLRKYGITVEEFDRMYERQGGACAICQQASAKILHVDHCHESGIIRGLLCNRCNVGLGNFADDPDRLSRAARYLWR